MMMPTFETQRVNLDLVKLDDKESNVRVELDDTAVSEYQEIWERARQNKEGNPFANSSEPIALFWDGEAYWVGDGRHRLKGARQAEIEFINLPVAEGTKEDAILFACSKNDKHGVRLTRADKHRIVRKALSIKPDWAASTLAKWCNVSEAFVRKIKDSQTGSTNLEERAKAKARKIAAPEPPKPKKQAPVPTEEQKVTKAYGEAVAKKMEDAGTVAKNIVRWISTLAKCLDDYQEVFDDQLSKKRHDAIMTHLNYCLDEFTIWNKATMK
jgi:hypothetical protein